MLLLSLMHHMSIGLFRFLGAFGRSMVIANTMGAFTILITFLLGGFVIAKGEDFSHRCVHHGEIYRWLCKFLLQHPNFICFEWHKVQAGHVCVQASYIVL